MESALNPSPGSDIREQAAEWFVVRQQGLDAARMQQFARWLATSPAHLAEYHAMERLGRELPLAMGAAPTVDELVEEVGTEAEEENVVLFERPGSMQRPVRFLSSTWAVAAVLAFVAVDVLVLWPMLKDRLGRDAGGDTFASQPGEFGQTWRSADRTVSIQLDTDSEVDLSGYGGKQLLVRQVRGRVSYEIHRDMEEPRFLVDAGDLRIRHEGTTFSVYMMESVTRITVLEGEVEVSAKGVPGAVRIGAGGQLDAVPGQPLGDPVTVDAGRAMQWTSGQLEFDNEPLSDAVGEINRYLRKPYRIESGTLGSRRVHFTFSTTAGDRSDRLRAFLIDTMGARVQEESDRIVVTSR